MPGGQNIFIMICETVYNDQKGFTLRIEKHVGKNGNVLGLVQFTYSKRPNNLEAYMKEKILYVTKGILSAFGLALIIIKILRYYEKMSIIEFAEAILPSRMCNTWEISAVFQWLFLVFVVILSQFQLYPGMLQFQSQKVY